MPSPNGPGKTAPRWRTPSGCSNSKSRSRNGSKKGSCRPGTAPPRGALTVRQMEKLAARRAQGKQPQPPAPPQLDPNIRSALEELQRHLGTRVVLRQKTKMRAGQLVVEFYDHKQLMGLYDRLMK